MGGVEWAEELPPAKSWNRIDWQAALIPLRARPGEWAIVGRKDSPGTAAATASNLRRGYLDLPAGQWEFAARTVDGEHRVYARYLGPEE